MGDQNVDFLGKLLQEIKPYLRRPQADLEAIELEIQNGSTIKDLDGKLCYKSLKKMPIEKYKTFVERLQNRFKVSNETADSMLDALYCGENEEKVESLKFIENNGHINHGWYITEKKDGKIDVAYAIYAGNFKMAQRKSWVFKWWYIFPVGWKYEVEEPTKDQKAKLDAWCM